MNERAGAVMNFIEQGEYYGYPPCCIMHIIGQYDRIQAAAINRNMSLIKSITAEGNDESWYGTGYVPCPVCRSVINRDGLDAYIAARVTPNRKCKTPFPKGENE